MDVFDIKVDQKDKFLFVRVSGVINRNTLEVYRKRMDEVMQELDVSSQKNLKFVCDYKGVTQIDSSAIGNIQDRLQNAVREDHSVCFIHVPEQFRHLVELLQIGEEVKIFDSEDDAVKALQ